MSYKAWERNESNQNANGGTEQTVESLLERLDPELTSNFQIITSRVRDLREDKIRIYWLHDLAQDPELSHLRDENSRNRFHKIVYVSNWQQQSFQLIHGLPFDSQSCVLENPLIPFDTNQKSQDEVRLIYMSTPHRGLELLIPIFEKICEKYDNVVLDVFSSFKIYGWDSRDSQYEGLFDRCKTHPKINYHGYATPEVVREYTTKAHIFAYPNIWLETSCRCLMEAMSAGCLCIHPNYGALPDTSGGLTAMYQWDQNPHIHASTFYNILDDAIQVVRQQQTQNYLRFVKMYADQRFDIDKVTYQWETMLQALKYQYEGKSLAIPKKTVTFRT